jgi:HEAT repeat protein
VQIANCGTNRHRAPDRLIGQFPLLCLIERQIMIYRLAPAMALVLLPAVTFARPVTGPEAERQTQVLEQLKKSVAAEKDDADKFALIGGVLSAEKDPNFRRRVLTFAGEIKGAAQEEFFLSVLTADEDSGIRSLAATTLGKTGSEKSLAALAKSAASDRTSLMIIGDVGGNSSARRAATFAIAELALRHPKLAGKAAAELRALPDKFDPKDRESLADARLQSLYQVTRDESLLKPFFDRLKSKDPNERMDGANAFQFLNLKQAPPELIAALEDEDAGVRSNVVFVLGGIGDPKTVEPLMAIAANAQAERGPRANAISSLGRMRAKPAADLMEKLLADPSVATSAAISLYRITGKKVKEFPEGYNAD